MIYDVTLKIIYDYANAADASRQIMRLMPLDIPGEQRLVAGSQSVTPKPQEWINRSDFFGNRAVEIGFTKPHRDIVFAMQSRVERIELTPLIDTSASLPDLAGEISEYRNLNPWAPHHFLGNSPTRQTRRGDDQLCEILRRGDFKRICHSLRNWRGPV